MATKVLPDLNSLAILLVSDHPGHSYVSNELIPALEGEKRLVMFGYLPLRLQWILENEYGFETVDARNAVSSLVQYPAEWVTADGETILSAYEVSAEKNHDVYDSFYVALGDQHNVDEIVTTDRDFKVLLSDSEIEYTNPVPEEVLTQFSSH